MNNPNRSSLPRRHIQALCLVLLLTPTGAWATASVVAEVSVAQGEVSAQQPGGAALPLRKGASLHEYDLVTTGRHALVAIRFTDGTRFTLGPNSEFRIGEVSKGRPDKAEGAFNAEVLRGAFRFVTGLIARQRPRAMQVKTGVVATIGIRGTTVGGEVEGDSATIVLLENEDEPSKPSAIEVGNDHGSVTIDQTGYGTTVPDAHSPPTPPARMSLRAIENLVRNINSIQRISVPRPMIR